MTDRPTSLDEEPLRRAAGVRGVEPEGRANGSWALEEVYDEQTVELIERAARPRRSADRSPRGRGGLAGLLMTGVLTGVGEVLDPDRLQPEMVEFSPDHPDPESLPVQFIYVRGAPEASRLVVRPWLFGRGTG